MEYTVPAIPSTILKEPNIYKPKEPTKIAKETAQTAKDPANNAALTKRSPDLFALSQDFEEDPVHQLIANNLYTIPELRIGRPQKTTANKVEVVSKPYAVQVQETCLNENPNVSSDVPNLKGV
ncbi:hypothetical protein DSO57_1034917 [Entomophthora muscae]|uniref:Uncharacterized protein n=1 Tax=Entomophthora muscae TaxID=34485 RepID=A0ACC2S1N0_9FUNG|nr:hypothetical protein DSO57_1034917 [Entomophthora muscae]